MVSLCQVHVSSFTDYYVAPKRGKSTPSHSFTAVAASVSHDEIRLQSLSYIPLFSFASNETIERFDRIDDAIMGGVSSSTLLDIPKEAYSKWFGICRTTGGGFCGIRTLPFAQPLNISEDNADGFYLTCRLASDNEPERRAWKMSTRIKPDRGEQLYQARFEFSQSSPDEWSSVTVPFDKFRLVRGPRVVPDSPPLNISKGIYQIGMTMSKFDIGVNVTEVENFREGPFELQIKEIGVYSKSDESSAMPKQTINLPKIYSKKEAKKQMSVVLKILRLVSKLFFTEQSQRRKAAMKLLTTKRNFSRTRAILFGLKSRAASSGWASSVAKLMAVLCVDCLRSIGVVMLRIFLLYPTRLVGKIVAAVQSNIAKSELSAPSVL